MDALVSYFFKTRYVDFAMNAQHIHRKDNYEIMYNGSGRFDVEIEDTTVQLAPGQFIVIKSPTPHAIRCKKADILNVEFFLGEQGGVSLNEVLKENPDALRIFQVDWQIYNDDGSIFPALNDLIIELKSGRRGLMFSLLLRRFFVAMGRFNIARQGSRGDVVYIKRAKDYIKEHLEEKISSWQLADAAGINVSYLQTLFKQQTGQTIVEYINGLRIARARFLLRNTNLEILDVAVECGFASRQHFGLTFRKLNNGVSPMEYRKGIAE